MTETFSSPQAHGLLAPWVLHTGLGPDAAASGFMTRVIAVASSIAPSRSHSTGSLAERPSRS